MLEVWRRPDEKQAANMHRSVTYFLEKPGDFIQAPAQFSASIHGTAYAVLVSELAVHSAGRGSKLMA
jgi:hypothetical protein